jgi:hypothetical protein
MKSIRITIGILLWLIGVVAIGWCVDRQLVADGTVRDEVAADLLRYATTTKQRAELVFQENQFVAVGDPIVAKGSDGIFRQVGEVSAVFADGRPARRASTATVSAVFFEPGFDCQSLQEMLYYQTPNTMDWVLKTMLTKEIRTKIAGVIQTTVDDNRDVIIAELGPLVERSLRDAMQVLEQDLAASLKSHRDEIEQIAGRYQRDVLERELVPLVKTEIFPIVKRHAEPLANEIGIALWKRVSLWRFTWRYLYDKSPLPERNKFKTEWKRFLENEAMPELESRTQDILNVVKKIVAETARNKMVKSAVRRNMIKVVDDPELRKVVWKIINEVVVENPRLRESMKHIWTSDEARDALRLASERTEPAVQNIGRLLFGSPDAGITPEFARVLRNRILNKDKRWFEVVSSTDGTRLESHTIPVRAGTGNPSFPLIGRSTDGDVRVETR